MTTAFPGAIDAFTNPTASDPLDSVTVPHASQHANINDAVEAIETAIGTTAAPVLAPLASPTFTGTPAAPTAAEATNTTQLATTAFVIANRDTSFGFTTGLYYRALGTVAEVAGVVEDMTYYCPFVVNQTKTFDRIAIASGSTHSGTGVVRLGIYNNDSTTGKPSTVLLDAGTVSTTAPTTVFQITISQSLSPGTYWLAFNMQTAATTPVYRGVSLLVSSPIGYVISTTGTPTADAGWWTQTGVTGAFASAGTLVSAITGPAPTLRST